MVVSGRVQGMDCSV